MNCEECREFIDAYIDNELDAAAAIAVRHHLRECDACAQFLEARKALRALLDNPELRFDVPNSLHARVLSALPVAPAKPEERIRKRFVLPWFSVPVALAAVLVVLFGLALLQHGWVPGRSRGGTLVAQVISGHIRSLLATHLLDVSSTDQHTVKPWFAGKLEFSPPVQDFSQRGFSLIGGRLDYLGNREVAALVYRRNKHIINLFIWPSQPGHAGPMQSFAENGYNVLHWDQGGFSFWAVSDVRMEDLRAFAELEMQPS